MEPDQYDLIIDALHAARQVRAFHGSGIAGISKLDDIAAILRARANGLATIPGSAPLRDNRLALAVADAIEATLGGKQ